MKKKITIIIILLVIIAVSSSLIYKSLSNSKDTNVVEENVNIDENNIDSVEDEEIKIEKVDDPYESRVDYLEFTQESDELEFEISDDNIEMTEGEFHEPSDKSDNDIIEDPNALPDYVTIDENGQMTIDLSDGNNRTPSIGN